MYLRIYIFKIQINGINDKQKYTILQPATAIVEFLTNIVRNV